VAVPWLKHSARFGQAASSQTVCKLFSLKVCFIRVISSLAESLTRIQSGLRKMLSVFSTLIGIRASFSALRWCVCGVDREGALMVIFLSLVICDEQQALPVHKC
jgi:hypothetical protein